MFDFGKILGHMGVPAMTVASVLLLMALASLAVAAPARRQLFHGEAGRGLTAR